MSLDFSQYAPAAAYIKCAAGTPFIEGLRCQYCSAAFVKPHVACPACGGRAPLTAFRAAATGTVITYTVVSRSYPGIKVPFVSAFVKLDDGPVLKGVLRNLEPLPQNVQVGMAVQLVFDSANGLSNKEGRPYFSYFFEPAEPTQRTRA